MEKEELDKIIAKIENENPKEKAFFGVYIMNEDGHEASIKANKLGLELFACELLKASIKADEVIEDSEKNIIVLDTTEKWIQGDIWLGYIEPKSENREELEKKPDKPNWKDKAVKYGCFISITMLIIIFIIGIKTIISWFT
ncbi:hypothetical protein OX284_009440 [Flavobacterium sp. SUN046]|uniref:hypothetical protein n=1 Tax=Flavobacterium sp. SUN046 TaxID=3002440 RepID=UPI002DB5791D|nr:hypothetical protein [Flavobacterium sp. SUN046]MEC4049650.1 hypothetical protein [Flavobacterium sp. SUN046]